MEIRTILENYRPRNAQEARDRQEMLRLLDTGLDLWGREGPAHFTASAWVVSPDRKHVLMAYHRIYRAWSWLGGHADGDRDLKKVALREVMEESGLKNVRLADPEPLSLEILTVDGHEKRGSYVSSHLHLNLTWLVEADMEEKLTGNEEENAGAAWYERDAAVAASSEEWFRERIYSKLNRRLEETEKGEEP